MTSRERFVKTLTNQKPDRVPYFEEGIRNNVIKSWHKQGLPADKSPDDLFPKDHREEIEPVLDPIPAFKNWPSDNSEIGKLKKRLKLMPLIRLPQPWRMRQRKWHKRTHALLLRAHRGLFLSMGIYNDIRFREVMELLKEKPGFVKEYMRIYSDFIIRLLSKILAKVRVDALCFSEPIGGNEGPLISPRMYEEFVLESFKDIIKLAHRHHISIIIFRTYANARILIPSILKYGFNCLWAHEVNTPQMDYVSLRRQFGKDLKLIGGIDLDALRRDKNAIKKELETKVPFLLQDGGYIPLADGRIRSDIPFQNYLYYRALLQEIIQSCSG